jgi:hypothetical protein
MFKIIVDAITGRKTVKNGTKLCACGCGERISANKELKFGHEMPIAAPPEALEEPGPAKRTRKPRTVTAKSTGATEPKPRKPRAKKVLVVPAAEAPVAVGII